MADIGTILTVVAPLAITSITLLLWSLLVVIQSPRPYWRDSLNRSIAGLLSSLVILVLLFAAEEAAWLEVGAWGTRIVIVLAGIFALIGLPPTIAELRATLRRHPEV